MQYIDMHCDTLFRAYVEKKEMVYQVPEFMLDIDRMRKGNCLAQYFAIFMLPESMREELDGEFPEDLEYIKKLMSIFHKSVQEYSEYIAATRTMQELEENASNGKISGILTLEDGRVVDGRMDRLEWLYEQGIRMITLTWNYENCFGYPNSGDRAIMEKGLKPFGREAIVRMNELGMAVDVSHLSDGGFWDVVKLSQKPFVASHSNCRALSPHRRNMTDEMIRALAEKGGVMGLNFAGPFLNADAASRESTLERMILHLKHMVKVGGIEIAAIGTDFDGTDGIFDIPNCSKMQLLFETMGKHGFTEAQIEKIAYQNVKRVMGDIYLPSSPPGPSLRGTSSGITLSGRST